MGISIPKRKVREAACLGCIVKCDVYLASGNPSYFPEKTHKVPYSLRGLPEMLYHYCRHYDPTRISIHPENPEKIRNIYK